MMTLTVTVQAHCTDEREVLVEITDKETFITEIILQNGKTTEQVVYEHIKISVKERERN